MSLTDSFPPDYASGRRRFREATRRLGWELESHEIGLDGPDGEILTIDVALRGQRANTPALVISSGLHGVEGHFGSAVQCGLLDRWAEHADSVPDLNIVLLHGLNPFGFAWLRRFNEENIDLNRNFLLANEPDPESLEGYRRLNAFLNPPHPPTSNDRYLLKAIWAMATTRRAGQAVAAGQYDYPKGLFYGGKGPSVTQNILAKNLKRWIGPSSKVIHLDFHSGLGKSGQWKMLLDHPWPASQRDRLVQAFGAKKIRVTRANGLGYKPRGSLGPWCAQLTKGIDYAYACVEFGTYHQLTVLERLRTENQTHHWGSPDDAVTRDAKEALLEAFCPKSPQWRETVLNESYRIIELATAAS